MTLSEMKDRFTPAIEEIIDRCRVTDEIGRNTLRLTIQLLKKLSFERNQDVKKNDRNKLLISKELATDTFLQFDNGNPNPKIFSGEAWCEARA